MEDAWVHHGTAALVRSYEKDRLDLSSCQEELLFMEAVNRVTFDADNIPVVYNTALFSLLALLEQPEDPLRDEFTFQERYQD